MKVTILYTKNTLRGRQLLSALDDVIPTIADIAENYAVVFNGDIPGAPGTLVPDDVYRIFNDADTIPNPLSTWASQQTLKRIGASHTSMSMGDIVQIEGVIYICAREGWKKTIWPVQDA